MTDRTTHITDYHIDTSRLGTSAAVLPSFCLSAFTLLPKSFLGAELVVVGVLVGAVVTLREQFVKDSMQEAVKASGGRLNFLGRRVKTMVHILWWKAVLREIYEQGHNKGRAAGAITLGTNGGSGVC